MDFLGAAEKIKARFTSEVRLNICGARWRLLKAQAGKSLHSFFTHCYRKAVLNLNCLRYRSYFTFSADPIWKKVKL